MASSSHTIVLAVNGRRHTVRDADPARTLLDFLRRECGLTGAKEGCAEGGCGACTVLLSAMDPATGAVVHRSANSCLVPLCAVDHCTVTTVEGLGSVRTGLHPIQKRLAEAHGSQCGYCTPGIVMQMYALLKNNPAPALQDIEDAFDGNLCRCTGYRPILDAFKTFAREDEHAAWAQDACGHACTCLQNRENPAMCCREETPLVLDEDGDPQAAALAMLKSTPLGPLECVVEDALGRREWHRPMTLAALLALKAAHPTAALVVGNTEVGINRRLKRVEYPVVIAPTHVPELLVLRDEPAGAGLTIGAAVTLTRLRTFLAAHGGDREECRAMAQQLERFASDQIRNMACVGGNVCTASPISDLNPIFLATRAVFVAVSAASGRRAIPASEFFIGYRRIALQPDEILLEILVPPSRPGEVVRAFKAARRRHDDIAVLNCCHRVYLVDGKVSEAALAYGGAAVCSVLATHAADALVGTPFDAAALDAALQALSEDIPIPDGTPGGLYAYRRAMAATFLYKMQREVAIACGAPDTEPLDRAITRPISRGRQSYGPTTRTPVGEPLAHLSARMQVSGEAVYTGDTLDVSGTLHAHFVRATVACGRVTRVDAAPALALDGVVAYCDAGDVPGGPACGVLKHDEVVFAGPDGAITAVGQPIGLVVAETAALAREAAARVVVQVEEQDAILTIEQAIAAESYHGIDTITCGDADAALAEAPRVVEDAVYMGGQEHFYLECHCAYAVPGEDGRMEITSSTQAPTLTQLDVARALNVPASKIISIVRRMGGAFGGKESRASPIAIAAAVAAAKLDRPVRLDLDRDEDMMYMGGRHPFLMNYRVGFDDEGLLRAMDVRLYSNSGDSADLSRPVINRALFHVDNAYRFPVLRAKGFMCKTNLASNTAFRGFGAPQGVFLSETVLDRVARECGLPGDVVRRRNMYKAGERTHYDQVVERFHLPDMWDRLYRESKYDARRAAAAQFNREHKHVKRAIAMTPCKFGMSFTVKLLNQAGALVLCYSDGTVMVSHGGTEMGQGLNTKIAQITAHALGTSVDVVTVGDTATDKVPNTTPTSASSGADLNGAAVLEACEKINARLKPLREANPDLSFAGLCGKAFVERVSLSATGFYRTPDIGYDFDKDEPDRGRPFNYYSLGVAVSEVEVDCLTGEHQVLRADIYMDVGDSLNPALDVGQIEGAFVQGMGLHTLEEVVWGTPADPWLRPGHVFTTGPGTYKIPGFGDIPADFRVTLLTDAPNPRAVYSSKGIGEPPLVLAQSVFAAIKECIYAHRADRGVTGHFRFDSPATVSAIRLACEDSIAAAALAPGAK